MTQANTTRTVKSWDRRPWHDKPSADEPGSKLYRAEMTHVYTGIIEGEGTIQYLFANNENNQPRDDEEVYGTGLREVEACV